MAEFTYTVQDAKGNRLTSTAEAESVALLVSHLKNQGLTPLQIKPTKAQKKEKEKEKKGLFQFARKVKLKELVFFTRQLSSAINAGLLLSDALETISQDLENRQMGQVLREIINDVRSGSSFSKALAKHPSIFSKSYVAIVKAGEEGGSLNFTVDSLAKYLENVQRLTQKVKSAMFYPIFVFCFCMVVVGLIIYVVIPKFKMIFIQLGFELPLLTRAVVGVSEFAIRNSLWFVVSFIIFAALFRFILKFRKTRLAFDRLRLKVYIFGSIMKKAWMARFCRTLSILISGGVGLITALPLCGEGGNNLYLRETVEEIKTNIVGGKTLTNAFKEQMVFPRMFVKMVQVGERTGSLSEMLRRNADYFDEELEAALYALTTLIEPLLIIFIGSIVGVVVVAFYLPIFKVATLIR